MKKNTILTLLVSACSLCSCSPEFSKMGSGLLSSTGLMSSSQADALFTVGAKLSKATQSVTDEQEYYLGRSVAASVFARYEAYPNQSLALYSTKIANVLASYSTRPETFGGYHVAILNTDEVNAVSAPGGFIMISRGFINLLSNEDELAAIIAHEIGHVALKHGLSAISESNLTDALQIVGKEAVASSGNMAVTQLNALFGDSVNEVVGTLLDKGYSRSSEYDADEYAVTLLTKAGYNPQAMMTALKKLEQITDSKGGWASTHPSPADREDEVKSNIKAGEVVGEAKREKRFKGISK